MMRAFGRMIVLSLAVSAPALSADRDPALAVITPADETALWQRNDLALRLDAEYRRSVHNNRAVVQQELEVYARRLLGGGGIYSDAATVLGTALGASVMDTRVYLNDSRTMGMVFTDTASRDRAVLFQYRKTW